MEAIVRGAVTKARSHRSFSDKGRRSEVNGTNGSARKAAHGTSTDGASQPGSRRVSETSSLEVNGSLPHRFGIRAHELGLRGSSRFGYTFLRTSSPRPCTPTPRLETSLTLRSPAPEPRADQLDARSVPHRTGSTAPTSRPRRIRTNLSCAWALRLTPEARISASIGAVSPGPQHRPAPSKGGSDRKPAGLRASGKARISSRRRIDVSGRCRSFRSPSCCCCRHHRRRCVDSAP